MATYRYYNIYGNLVNTVSPMNFCRTKGPISECQAYEINDQAGCTYRRDASSGKACRYYRENFNGACDNLWAQKSIAMPVPEDKKEEEKKEEGKKEEDSGTEGAAI